MAELPASAEAAQARRALDSTDRDALARLGRAVDAHTFLPERLREPDFDIAGHARDAADIADGRTRQALLVLADSASRSALEFLVDYNMAAGAWEAASGIRMPAASPAAA
ncbi:hypothetical protein D7I44_06255 [Gryllotalpicola protaetiae]|uniref:Uncharacterized protein n=2 Tax=Gryllotalpicola protaetiae TaxID=2419771 RepID=A0A387BPY1_9MICO|nr:hypothetical protein D7I44_06255 [Gryllotalpicola protaetiae]